MSDLQKYICLIISIVFIVIVAVPIIFDFLMEFDVIYERFFDAKKIIFLIPTTVLLIEESLIKILKSLSKNYNL